MTNKIIVASFGDGDASRDAVALGIEHTEVRGATSVVPGCTGSSRATTTRGYGAVRRLVLGSTTADLLREATVPVVTLPRAVAAREAAEHDAVSASHA